MNKRFFRPAGLASLFAAFLTVQTPIAHAAMVTPDDIAAHRQADADRAKVQAFIERAGVAERMRAMGVDGVAARDRVAALSQEEVHALAQRIDSLPAGGLLGATDIIIVLLVVILVAVII